MNRSQILVAVLFCFGGIGSSAQAQYQSQIIPEATLEGTRRALGDLQSRVEPHPDAKRLVDVEVVGWTIALDVIQQHGNCFLVAESAKAKKPKLLDYELNETQKEKFAMIFSPEYRAEIVKSAEFGAMKMKIVSSLSRVNGPTLSKALELSQDQVGIDFVLAWLQPVLRANIDKSCGENSGEAVIDDWKAMFLWQLMAKRFGLN